MENNLKNETGEQTPSEQNSSPEHNVYEDYIFQKAFLVLVVIIVILAVVGTALINVFRK